MLYNAHAVSVLCSTDELQDVLATLRCSRNTELGDVTDANIRMLANEVDRVCFSNSCSEIRQQESLWTLSSSMNSNLGKLDKARQEAKKQLEIARQKAQKTFERTATSASNAMQKAEKAIERTANIVMQEAEGIFEGFADNPQSEQNSQWPFSPPPRNSQRMPNAAERQSGIDVLPRRNTPGSLGEDRLSRQLHTSMDEVVQRLKAAEARAVKADHALAVRIEKEEAAAIEDDKLIQQLKESSALIFGFTTRLAEAEGEREHKIRQTAQLEAEILAVQGAPVGHEEPVTEEERLRARIRALEAALTAGSAYKTCTTDEDFA